MIVDVCNLGFVSSERLFRILWVCACFVQQSYIEIIINTCVKAITVSKNIRRNNLSKWCFVRLPQRETLISAQNISLSTWIFYAYFTNFPYVKRYYYLILHTLSIFCQKVRTLNGNAITSVIGPKVIVIVDDNWIIFITQFILKCKWQSWLMFAIYSITTWTYTMATI